MNRRALSLIALFLVPLSLVALPQTLRAAEACTAEEHRQFDFWLGKWTAYSADGKKQGTNHITRLMSAYALQENWLGVCAVEDRHSGLSDNCC